MKKVLLIVNPCAGRKRGNAKLAEIVRILNEAGYETTIHVTTARGDATKTAEAYAAQMEVIACVGGDGTLNEVITGVLESGSNTPIGYIPAGSTNDFATSLKLPKKILQSAQLIAAHQPTDIDIGKFQQRYFTYIASFGAFTKASYATPQKVKNIMGHMAYILSGVKELTHIRKWHCRFETEEGETIENDFIFGAISNSTSVAGILTLDPKVIDLHDGQFELLLIKSPKNAIELGECIRALLKNDYDSKMLIFRKTRSVEVFCDSQMDWTLDGEMAQGEAQIHIENLHNAVKLLL